MLKAGKYHRDAAKKRQSAAADAPLVASDKKDTLTAPGAVRVTENVVEFPSENGKAHAD